jgi:hypothetical protein
MKTRVYTPDPALPVSTRLRKIMPALKHRQSSTRNSDKGP